MEEDEEFGFAFGRVGDVESYAGNTGFVANGP